MLGKPLLYTFCKPELKPVWIKFGNKLNDVKDPNLGNSDNCRCRKPLVGSMSNDFLGL